MIKSVERWSIVKILPGPDNNKLVSLVFNYIESVQSNFFCRSIYDRISLTEPTEFLVGENNLVKYAKSLAKLYIITSAGSDANSCSVSRRNDRSVKRTRM